jgi:hypothetical protein
MSAAFETPLKAAYHAERVAVADGALVIDVFSVDTGAGIITGDVLAPTSMTPADEKVPSLPSNAATRQKYFPGSKSLTEYSWP